DVAAFDLGLERAGGAHPDEGVRAERGQLLEGARRRAAAGAGRAAGDADAGQPAGEGAMLAVVRDGARLRPLRRDQAHPLRVPGQQDVALHVPAPAPDVVLEARVHLGPGRCRLPLRRRHGRSSQGPIEIRPGGVPKVRTGTTGDTASSAQKAMSTTESTRCMTAAVAGSSKASPTLADTGRPWPAIRADSLAARSRRP